MWMLLPFIWPLLLFDPILGPIDSFLGKILEDFLDAISAISGILGG